MPFVVKGFLFGGAGRPAGARRNEGRNEGRSTIQSLYIEGLKGLKGRHV